PEIFLDSRYARIWTAIRTVALAGVIPDPEAVAAELARTGELDAAGGRAFVLTLYRPMSPGNTKFHTLAVMEAHMRRRAVEIGTKLADDGRSGDPFEVLQTGMDSIASSLQFGGGRSQSMAEIIPAVHEKTVEMHKRRIAEGEDFVAGLSTGFRDLNKNTSGYHPGDFVVLAGRPGMGKTAFAISTLTNLALDGVPVGIFSLEMGKEQLAQRIIAQYTGIDIMNLRNANLSQSNWQVFNDSVARLAKMPLHIDDTPAITLFDLNVQARLWVARHKIKLLVVDYLQLMSGIAVRGKSREQEVAEISKGIKELAKAVGIPIIALSQLSRAVETRGGDKKPLLSDLRESGSIEQDADVVMFVYRPEYYGLNTYEDGSSTIGMAEVIIAKQRSGPVGPVMLGFRSYNAQFHDLPHPNSVPI
ncbi:MAG: replicative DNA helicase, partial [Bacteroidota bacterium]